MGVGALGAGDREPGNAAATSGGQHLEAGRREAAPLLLRPQLVHRPGARSERQAARRLLVASTPWRRARELLLVVVSSGRYGSMAPASVAAVIDWSRTWPGPTR